MMSSLRATTMLSGFVGCGFLAASAASAADADMYTKVPPAMLALGPAVDGFNAKFDGYGGSIANRSVYGTTGSFTVPLSAQYGAQVDGNIGTLDGDTFGSVGGHWFWRNPSQALLGVYADSTFWDRFGGVNVTRVAGEAEFYFGRFTLQGIAGVEFGNSASSTVTTLTTAVPPLLGTTTTTVDAFSIKTRFFDEINLKYYFTNDFSGYVGHRYLGGKDMLAFGTEIAFPLGRGVMATAFAEGRIGEGDDHGVWGGVKIYFGPTDKPLIERHRRDDPNNWTTDNPFSLFGNQTGSNSTTPVCAGRIVNGRCESAIQ